jgi:hypothetical protein
MARAAREYDYGKYPNNYSAQINWREKRPGMWSPKVNSAKKRDLRFTQSSYSAILCNQYSRAAVDHYRPLSPVLIHSDEVARTTRAHRLASRCARNAAPELITECVRVGLSRG